MVTILWPVVFVLEAFGKVLIDANNLVHLKQEQDEAVNCSFQARGVLAAMPTETVLDSRIPTKRTVKVAKLFSIKY